MPEIEIRPMTSTDIPFLNELEHGYTTEFVWQMDTLPLSEGGIQITFQSVRYPRSVKVKYPRPMNFTRENWTERAGILVATLAGEQSNPPPIAYASLSIGNIVQNVLAEGTQDHPATTAWLNDLVVKYNLRRKGIGTALLLTSLDWSAEHGCRKLIMAIQPMNQPAINLLKKLGFSFSGYLDHFFPNGDIGLFFVKDL
jgi:ribosomal protein S18 acetylase RimI-like enzyme